MAAIFKKILLIILVAILKNGGHFKKWRPFLQSRPFLKNLVQNLGFELDVKRHKYCMAKYIET